MPFGNKVTRWTIGLCQIALAAVFIVAGLLKAADPNAFAEEVMRYQLVPWPVAVTLGLWLPFLEIMAGAGIFIPALRAGALATITALLGIFTAALLSAWQRGLNIDCGCFGPALGPQTVIQALERDGLLLAMLAGVWVYQLRRRRASVTTPSGAAPASPQQIP